MHQVDATELSYLIQEGQGKAPIVKEQLVRNFYPFLDQLIQHAVHEIETNARLGLIANTFYDALANPQNLHNYSSIKTWLSEILINQLRAIKPVQKINDQAISFSIWCAAILTKQFQFSLSETGESIGVSKDKALNFLNQLRNKLIKSTIPRGRSHKSREINLAAVGEISWQDPLLTEHLSECQMCQAYLEKIRQTENIVRKHFLSFTPASVVQKEILWIIDQLDQKLDQNKQLRSLPVKEFLWAGSAMAVFFLLIQVLNPLWTIAPTQVPTPTQPTSLKLSSSTKNITASNLERSLLFTFPPNWQIDYTVLAGRNQPSTPISFSSSKYMVMYGSENGIVLWDLALDQQTILQTAGFDSFNSIKLSNSNYFAARTNEGEIFIWDLENLRLAFVLPAQKDFASEFSFSSGTNVLLTAGPEDIWVWDYIGETYIRTNTIPWENTIDIKVDSSEKYIAALDSEDTIAIWDRTSLSNLVRFSTPREDLRKISFSPNSELLSSISADGTLVVTGLSPVPGGGISAAILLELEHRSEIVDLAWTPDSRYLATLVSEKSSNADTSQQSIYLWDLQTGLPAALPLILEDDLKVTQLHIDKNGNLNLAARDGTIFIYPNLGFPDLPEVQYFTTSKTDLLPTQLALDIRPDPLALPYEEDFAKVENQIGYSGVLTNAIPTFYVSAGAHFDEQTGRAYFKFSRSLSPGREEDIYLQVSSFNNIDGFQTEGDWVGASANPTIIQMGRLIGEKIEGGWVTFSLDPEEFDMRRWDRNRRLMRYRWEQNGRLFELVSASDLATANVVWDYLFQPLALGLVGMENPNSIFQYAIRTRDTCTSIAAQYATSVGKLRELNDLNLDCDLIADELLWVPLPPAVGVFESRDLDCDGTEEIIRLVPDPTQPDFRVYFGIQLEDIPAENRNPQVEYTPFWSFTIADLDVGFFKEPELVQLPGICETAIWIESFGGDPDLTGLYIFTWNGSEAELLLAVDGYLTTEITNPTFNRDTFSFSTRNIEYDQLTTACKETYHTYQWIDQRFKRVGSKIVSGVPCFDGAP